MPKNIRVFLCLYSCAVVLNGGYLWLFPSLEMDVQLHKLTAKMGYVGKGYKVFYEVMAIFLLFFTPSLQKNSIYFHVDSSILTMDNLSLFLYDSFPLNLSHTTHA